jgi:broad specificity phosphatase PhoE
MKVILVRHGETEENKARISQGWLPGRLSELGIEQAKKVSEKLKDEKVDFIFSSDLARAHDTAKNILQFHDIQNITLDERLREQCKGIEEGKTYEERNNIRNQTGKEKHEYVPENGESWEQLENRASNFLNHLSELPDDKNAIVVSHGGTLSCMTKKIDRDNNEERESYTHSNTGVTYLEKTNGTWKIVKLNDTEHLE